MPRTHPDCLRSVQRSHRYLQNVKKYDQSKKLKQYVQSSAEESGGIDQNASEPVAAADEPVAAADEPVAAALERSDTAADEVPERSDTAVLERSDTAADEVLERSASPVLIAKS